MATPFRLARVNANLMLLLVLACSSLCTVSNAFSLARQTSTSPRALSCFVTPPLQHRFITASRVVSRTGAAGPGAVLHPTPSSRLFASQDDDTDASASTSRPKRRVRRRKEVSDDDASSDDTDSSSTDEKVSPEATAPMAAATAPVAAAPVAAAPAVDLKPREAAKPMQVRDIRDLVPGGRAEAPSAPEEEEMASTSSSRSSPQPAPTKSMYVSSGAGSNSENTGNLDDSLKMMMADARKMQTESDTEMQEAIDNGTAESRLPNKIRGVISTIITVDFFVVCGFLLWFLVGIVVRSLTDNDAVQIAFNNQFQTLVQPAIGILMVGSAAGAVFPGEED